MFFICSVHGEFVSKRALLMVLENIESNVELDDKPPSKDKAKGADSNSTAESDSRNPNKAKKGWMEKHCSLCKKHGGVHTTHNTKECRKWNKDGTLKKTGKSSSSNARSRVSFAQAINKLTAEVQKLKKEAKTKKST